MYWLIPAGLLLAGAAALLYNSLRDSAEAEHHRWRGAQGQLQQRVAHHNTALQRHLGYATTRLQLAEAKAARRQSIALADETYLAMRSARTCLKAMGQTLHEAKVQREQCRQRLKAVGLSYDDRAQLHAQLHQLNALRTHVFEERALIQEEHDRLLEQVRAMNQRTAQLRDTIEAFYSRRW